MTIDTSTGTHPPFPFVIAAEIYSHAREFENSRHPAFRRLTVDRSPLRDPFLSRYRLGGCLLDFPKV